MIDFRYHLVSLISVFVALAIGIVLGAGPLKEPIGDSLQNQVDSLRADRDDLRTQLDQSKTDVADLNEFITATAPDLLKGTLTDVPVTLVRTAETNADAVNAVRDRLSEAGAKVHDGGELSGDVFNPKGADDLVTQLRGIDKNLPEDQTEALTTALAQAISVPAGGQQAGGQQAGGQAAGYSREQAEAVLKAFAESGRINGGGFSPADIVVLIAPPVPAAPNARKPEAEASAVPEIKPSSYSTFATALDKGTPTIVAGTTAAAENGLVGYVRENSTGVSSVDSIELGAGPVITALTAADLHKTKTEGHYGFAGNAQAIMPGAAS